MVLSSLRGVLARRPLLNSIVTVTSLIGGADISCQLIEYKAQEFDWKRLQNMITIGAGYYGPMYFYYYGYLDRKLPGKNPRTVFLKVLIDQVLYTVPSLFVFYCIMGKLESKTNGEIKEEIRLKYVPTYVTSALFWPAAQIVNFAVVPPSFRILYISSASFVWLIFLSYIKNRPQLPVFIEKIQETFQGSSQQDDINESQEVIEDKKSH